MKIKFFIDLGLGMVFWRTWFLSFGVVLPHSVPCFTFRQWSRVACASSRHAQTTPKSEYQWVLFLSIFGTLVLFSQEGGGYVT